MTTVGSSWTGDALRTRESHDAFVPQAEQVTGNTFTFLTRITRQSGIEITREGPDDHPVHLGTNYRTEDGEYKVFKGRR